MVKFTEESAALGVRLEAYATAHFSSYARDEYATMGKCSHWLRCGDPTVTLIWDTLAILMDGKAQGERVLAKWSKSDQRLPVLKESLDEVTAIIAALRALLERSIKGADDYDPDQTTTDGGV